MEAYSEDERCCEKKSPVGALEVLEVGEVCAKSMRFAAIT